ncbi:MAG: hypothetical protein AAF546_12495 [Verrucomicrobiota bacterium]
MERVIRWSGVSSVILFWVSTVYAIASEIIRKDVIIVDAVITIFMVMLVVWLDRMAAFKKNIFANTLSLLFWSWMIFASAIMLREEINSLGHGILVALLGSFALSKIISAVLIFISKSKTEPVGMRRGIENELNR